MKRDKRLAFVLSIVVAAAVCIAISNSTATSTGAFKVIKLVGSAGSGAHKRDAHMINAWGNAFFPGNPFWINDQGSGVSELIDGQGTIFNALPFVKVPPGAGGGKGQPTGIVANLTSDFVLSSGGKALFIFATEDGTISGWNQSSGATAVIVVNNTGKATYTGLALALAQNGNANQLYAANQGVTGHPGSIDVFDASFKPVTSSGFPLPNGFTPYNIANINGNLFVSYSMGLQAVGRVDEFDPNGTFIMKFTSDTLAAPWGLVVAPSNFGAFSNDLLVGNLIDGTISAFNLTTGKFLDQLVTSNQKKLAIPGLWSLIDGDGALNARADVIYFTAGPRGYAAGLFGLIEAVAAKPHTPIPTPTVVPYGYQLR